MAHILVIANETAASQTLLDALRGEAGGERPGHGDRAGQRAEPGLRRLRGHAPRVGGPAAREDAEGASRGRAWPRRASSSRPGPVQAVEGRARAARAEGRRDRRLDARRGALGLDAPERRRGHRARGAGRPRRARRRRATTDERRDERARDREPDGRLGRAARPHPQAGRAGPGELPDRRPAERRRGARRGRPAPPARAQRAARARASTRTGRSSIPTRTRRPMQVVNDERVDEIIVSTFPGERSGWLRRDLVERLRKDTGLPVEHVISGAQRPQVTRMSAAPKRTTMHGPPPIHYSSRVSPAVLGMFLFIASEIMLFGSFFTVYFFDRVVNNGVDGVVAARAGYARVRRSSRASTRCILVTSSFTMHWADTSIKKGNRAGLSAGIVLTFLPRPDLPADAGDRVPPDRLQHERHVVRGHVLRPHRPARRPRVRRPDDPRS